MNTLKEIIDTVSWKTRLIMKIITTKSPEKDIANVRSLSKSEPAQELVKHPRVYITHPSWG